MPIRLNTGFWPAKSAGLTAYEAMSDPARAAQAWKDFNLKFQPDASVDPVHNTVPTSMFEALDYKLYSWPGHGVAKEASYQYREQEWMLPEEYDHLISDPADYMLRIYLPRTVGAFAGFGKLVLPPRLHRAALRVGQRAGRGAPRRWQPASRDWPRRRGISKLGETSCSR